jgi:hypothetical protein
VRVSANAGTPEPPLVTVLDLGPVVIGAALVAALGAGLVWAVARAAFREPAPVRAAGADG